MSVDFFPCKACERTFPDCGPYVSCDCGNVWCSKKCAKEDGFIDIEDLDEEDQNNWKHSSITCKYCRGEDVESELLFEFLMKKHNLKKEEIIKEYFEYLKKNNTIEE